MKAERKTVVCLNKHLSPHSLEDWCRALEKGMTPWGKEVWSAVKLEEGDEITVTSVKRFYYEDRVEVGWLYWAGEEPEVVDERTIWKENGHEHLVTLRLKAPSVIVEWMENMEYDEESERVVAQQRTFVYLCM